MIEKGMRGGISQISQRYASANPPDKDGFKSFTKTLIYQDANALYSWAMSQLLPMRSFKWIDSIDVTEIPDDNPLGYILEVDLEYPRCLHDAHNDYPLAPEHLEITDNMLSPFQKRYFPPINGKIKKLTPNLRDKEKYVVHYRTLKLYLSLGMKIKKIHRTIQFEQSSWMKPYINLNTNLRKVATQKGDKVGKDLFKLMNNAVFGKTCENLRKRINFEVVTSRKTALKRFAKPNFKRAVRFREDLVGIHTIKPVLILNRPIHVGFTILDISKYHMYNFHYNIWLNQFPCSHLLFTDTDSLAYEVIGHDVYAGMSLIKDEFDFSEYPKDHFLYSTDNMKVVGKFKDECHGLAMLKFVGLRPKLYSYEYERIGYFELDGTEVEKPTNTSVEKIVISNKNTGKGIKDNVRKEFTLDDYKDNLHQMKPLVKEMNSIHSIGHNLYSCKVDKISLSAFDNKRWILEDGIRTLAYGHYNTL